MTKVYETFNEFKKITINALHRSEHFQALDTAYQTYHTGHLKVDTIPFTNALGGLNHLFETQRFCIGSDILNTKIENLTPAQLKHLANRYAEMDRALALFYLGFGQADTGVQEEAGALYKAIRRSIEASMAELQRVAQEHVAARQKELEASTAEGLAIMRDVELGTETYSSFTAPRLSVIPDFSLATTLGLMDGIQGTPNLFLGYISPQYTLGLLEAAAIKGCVQLCCSGCGSQGCDGNACCATAAAHHAGGDCCGPSVATASGCCTGGADCHCGNCDVACAPADCGKCECGGGGCECCGVTVVCGGGAVVGGGTAVEKSGCCSDGCCSCCHHTPHATTAAHAVTHPVAHTANTATAVHGVAHGAVANGATITIIPWEAKVAIGALAEFLVLPAILKQVANAIAGIYHGERVLKNVGMLLTHLGAAGVAVGVGWFALPFGGPITAGAIAAPLNRTAGMIYNAINDRLSKSCYGTTNPARWTLNSDALIKFQQQGVQLEQLACLFAQMHADYQKQREKHLSVKEEGAKGLFRTVGHYLWGLNPTSKTQDKMKAAVRGLQHNQAGMGALARSLAELEPEIHHGYDQYLLPRLGGVAS